ncbi:MAG: hypothetical protein AAF938_10180 [Myxococcota bacterium]
MYGDEIDLLQFTLRDGGHGFYVRKRFDHGDDYTDFCAAFGAPESAFALTATSTEADARAAAATFLSGREVF